MVMPILWSLVVHFHDWGWKAGLIMYMIMLVCVAPMVGILPGPDEVRERQAALLNNGQKLRSLTLIPKEAVVKGGVSRVFKHPALVPFCLTFGLYGFVVTTPYFYLPKMAVETAHLSVTQASALVSILGAFNTVGRLVFGLAGDRWDPLLAYGVGYLGAGAALTVLPLVKGFWPLAAISAAVGLFLASVPSLVAVVTIHLFGISHLNTIMGYCFCIGGIGFFVGSSCLGHIFESNGHDYKMMMWIGSGIYLTALICIVICWKIELSQSKLLESPPREKKNKP